MDYKNDDDFDAESFEIKFTPRSKDFLHRNLSNASDKMGTETANQILSTLLGTDETLEYAKEALRAKPQDRTEIQIEAIFVYLERFNFFDTIPAHETVMNLCNVVEFYEPNPDEVLVSFDSKIKSFYGLINGNIAANSQNYEDARTLYPGECFGLPLSFNEACQTSSFEYRAIGPNCQLVVVNYEKFIKFIEDKKGKELDSNIGTLEASFDGDLIVTATVDKLIDMLFDDAYNKVEPNYSQFFFFVSSIFVNDYTILLEAIKKCFKKDALKQRVVAVLLKWLTYCPDDFESPIMQDFLSFLISEMKNKPALGEIIAMICFDRSHAFEYKFIIDETQDVPFRLKYRYIKTIGNTTSNFELYVSFISENLASAGKLKLHDQIIIFNDCPVQSLTHEHIQNFLKSCKNFIFVVKRCEIKFQLYKNSLKDIFENKNKITLRSKITDRKCKTLEDSTKDLNKHKTNPKQRTTGHGAVKNNSVDDYFPSGKLASKSISTTDILLTSFKSNILTRKTMKRFSVSSFSFKNRHFCIRIYTIHHECRYFYISRVDSVENVLADFTSQFLIGQKSFTLTKHRNPAPIVEEKFYMFKVYIINDFIKISRLPEFICDLPSLIKPGERFYIAKTTADINITSDIHEEMIAENFYSFLDLNTLSIAKMLTLTDFYYFTLIPPREYISSFAKSNAKKEIKNLTYFEQRCNKEVNWTINEVLQPTDPKRRAKTIAKFIQIAKYCIELGNFNSFFSIIAGLEDKLISRLKSTWELIPQKMMKVYKQLVDLCDPRNNMSAYRAWLLNQSIKKIRSSNSIIIPLIPLLGKDIFVINENFKSFVGENRVNFRKMRLISNELRKFFYFYNPDFTLDEALKIDEKNNFMILEKPSLTIGLKCSNQTEIMLANIATGVLTFIEYNQPGTNDDHFYPCDKKLFDEFINLYKINHFLEKIDSLKFDFDDLQNKSYEYDTPPQFILDKMKSRKISAGAISTITKSTNSLSINSKISNSSSPCISDLEELGSLV